jgi:hypothetical protein
MQGRCEKSWPENLKGRDHLKDPCTDGKIIFKQIFKEQGVGGCGLA